jgi:hypothetical protein
MPRCLNTEEIRRLRHGAMAAEELLRADLHIAGCEDCRARLLDSSQLVGAARSLAGRVRWNPKLEFNCLDDEQAAAYVEGALDATDREIVDSHLATCSRCVEDVRSLEEFRAEMIDYPETVFGPEPRRVAAASGWAERMRALFAPRRLAWSLAGAAVVLAAFFGGRLWRDARPSPRMEQVEAQLRATREQLARTERELQDAKQNAAAAEGRIERQESELAELRNRASRKVPAERTLALKDGSGAVEVRLKLPSDLPRDLALATAQLLETGEAAASELAQQTLARLVTEGEEVRSGSEAPSPPGDEVPVLFSPVRTLVLSDRPAFRWAPVKGATGYVISFFQNQPRRLLWEQSVGMQGESAFPSDRPPLSPGETYAWMVEARMPDRSFYSKLARFEVLGGSRRAEVQTLSRRYAGWHTVLAALYEREGLYDEAARELQSLVRRNPGSKSARRLLDALRSR